MSPAALELHQLYALLGYKPVVRGLWKLRSDTAVAHGWCCPWSDPGTASPIFGVSPRVSMGRLWNTVYVFIGKLRE